MYQRIPEEGFSAFLKLRKYVNHFKRGKCFHHLNQIKIAIIRLSSRPIAQLWPFIRRFTWNFYLFYFDIYFQNNTTPPPSSLSSLYQLYQKQ